MSRFDLRVNTKIKLMKIDLCMESIRRINRDTPSLYVIPKNTLSEARSALYSDVAKCKKLTVRALRGFQNESAVASKYNLLRERIEKYADSKVRAIDAKYNEAIRRGDYKEADVLVRQLQGCGNLFRETHDHLEIDADVCRDGINISVTGRGLGKGRITVKNVSVTCNGSNVRCRDACSFTMGPTEDRHLMFDGGEGTVRVTVSYFAEGHENRIDRTITGADRWSS